MIVVLSQNTLSGPTIRNFEESFVADLLMKENLEVSIIDCLSELQPDDTGHLCLQGIKGDMFLSHWGDTEAAVSHLKRLNIVGTVAAVSSTEVTVIHEPQWSQDALPILAPGVYDANRRNIYLMSLEAFDTSFPATRRIAQIAANPNAIGQSSPDSAAHLDAETTNDTDTVRPMPKRSTETSTTSDDPLESLLGDLDELDL